MRRRLAAAGVEVAVYEALHVVGGVLALRHPEFRLPRDIITGRSRGSRSWG